MKSAINISNQIMFITKLLSPEFEQTIGKKLDLTVFALNIETMWLIWP